MSFINPSLPLIDLHRHLDGSVRLQTIIELSRQHNLPLPAWEVEALRPHAQITDAVPSIAAFFEKFKYQTQIMVNAEACRRIAYENVEDAKREGIAYIELRFSPWFMSLTHQLNPHSVVEAVVDGVRAGARDFGVRVNLIGILSRSYGAETAFKELDALLAFREALIAIDLAGLEKPFPCGLFAEHFTKARNAGLHITIHAGEEGGAQFVWDAINLLGAERIGHAVHAPDDPRLMDYLAAHRIGIEANLTSNIQTTSVPSYATHPMKLFLERGLLATLNTDDPGISAIDLPYEYNIAAPAAGLTAEHIEQAQRNALTIAFLSETEKQALVR